MNLLKLQNHPNLPKLSRLSKTTLHSLSSSLSPHRFLCLSPAPTTSLSSNFNDSRNRHIRASTTWSSKEEEEISEDAERFEYLAKDGEVFQKTLRLVETAMFAAVSGLAYLLSNSLAIESYFGCFFALPIVISSIRWGVVAGRKTMVATVVLLFVLSGPVKAVNYMLMHGLLGFTMGSLWRLRTSWTRSIFLCSLARATGAIGYVLLTSFLIGENILHVITINIHASLAYVLTSIGSNSIPSMNIIYTIFGTLVNVILSLEVIPVYSLIIHYRSESLTYAYLQLLINSIFFVLLLHILYAIFFAKFRMKASLRLPKWVDVAI